MSDNLTLWIAIVTILILGGIIIIGKVLEGREA